MSYALLCLLLALVTGVVTELLPVKSEYRPLVPKVCGLVAVAVGVSQYGLSYEEAVGVFGAALSSSWLSGLVKFTLGAREPLIRAYERLWGPTKR